MAYLGSTPTTQSFIAGTDTFSGTGSQTAFTLSRPVNTVNDILVVVNNVDQQPSSYTVSGSTLTFSSAPSSGTNNVYVRYLTTTLQTIAPSPKTVGLPELSATGTASAATFLRGDNTWATVINSGTVVASTSGTSIDFTGIPSSAKRITVMFNGVSTNGVSVVQIQIGSTTFSTSGYTSGSYVAAQNTSTSGFNLTPGGFASSASTLIGSITLSLLNSNTWVANGVIYISSTANAFNSGVSPALAGALDRVRITTVNGTDTFDAGSINILYE